MIDPRATASEAALLDLATRAAAAWGVPAERVAWLTRELNAFCRITLPDGSAAALRMVSPHLMDHDRLTLEAAWLDHLAACDPEIGAARCRRTLDGRPWIEVRTAAVPGGRRCSVLSWVPGERLGAEAPVEAYGALGRLMARLHRCAETFTPPVAAPIWERTWEKGHPDALFGPRAEGLLSTRDQALIRAAGARCDGLIARLIAKHGVLLLHADLHPWNVFADGGRLHPLDFGDVVLGAPPMDFAAPLGCLLDRPDYPAVRDAFAEGYTALRPGGWVDAETLEGVQHAYWLLVIDFLVREGRRPYHHRIDETLRRLERWLGPHG